MKALDALMKYTDGQPWRVNRVCAEVVKRAAFGKMVINEHDIHSCTAMDDKRWAQFPRPSWLDDDDD